MTGIKITILSPNEDTLREIIVNLGNYIEWTLSKVSYTDCPEDYDGHPQHWLAHEVVYYVLYIYTENIDTCSFDGFDALYKESLPENYQVYGTPRLKIEIADTNDFYDNFDELKKDGTLIDSSLGT